MKVSNFILMTAMALCSLPSLAQDEVAAPSEDDRREEREAYVAARKMGTVEAWEIFINNYPESYYIEQARKMRDNAIVNSYCNKSTTLEKLVTYVEDNSAHEPRIKTFYANLVNNPTHSYRYEHMDIGFNGCTGRVDEHIEWADGSRARDNYFVFNEMGLLVEASVMGSSGKVNKATYEYDYDNLHGYRLKSMKGAKKNAQFEAMFDDNDKLEIIIGDNGNKWVYSYNDLGALNKLVVTTPTTKRTLVYNDGYIIREETAGKVLRYLYDYDTATLKKYLIGINEIADREVVHERKVEYSYDSKGRITRADITLDGKPQMTITRTYDVK